MNLLILILKFFSFLGSIVQALQITNITTIPFLPDNKIARRYFGLKLMIRIEAASSYRSCSWLKDETPIGVIFSDNIPCNNEENIIYRFSCVNMSQVVTATVNFVSPVAMNNSGNYQVKCFKENLKESTIAQLTVMVMGKTSCYKLR